MGALSFNNPNVQQLRRLLGRRSARHGDGQFVVEGPVLTAEAVAAGWTCLAQYVPEGAGDEAVAGAGPVNELGPGVLERVASTDSPQPPLTVVKMPTRDAGPVLSDASFVIALDRVQDPGNVGTILRSAEAAGADVVVLTPGSVDPFNPKVVRASAGALFHLPVVTASYDDLAAAGLRVVGTSSHDGAGRTVTPHDEADWRGRIALVMGNEAAGLPAEWDDDVGPIDTWVTIRQRGRGESLNVAMATTVLAFEAARHRQPPDA
ncbi:MAG: TrmH family RNA methyltransferase [Ilumatobacteraceae bacterium]